eukprot:SAG11_NODE_193_length_12862_cov_7.128888_11_plen_186_part_00
MKIYLSIRAHLQVLEVLEVWSVEAVKEQRDKTTGQLLQAIVPAGPGHVEKFVGAVRCCVGISKLPICMQGRCCMYSLLTYTHLVYGQSKAAYLGVYLACTVAASFLSDTPRRGAQIPETSVGLVGSRLRLLSSKTSERIMKICTRARLCVQAAHFKVRVVDLTMLLTCSYYRSRCATKTEQVGAS